MKCGTTASLFTYAYLHELRESLKGQLTLTVVSDEETFGPWGARHLIEHYPEVHGDCCLSGEPSDPSTIRFGEKGTLWLKFEVASSGGHSAYPHRSGSASKAAVALLADLRALEDEEVVPPGNIGTVLVESHDAMEHALGAGASGVIQNISVNFGVIQAGVKINMVPSLATIEVDLRLPVGIDRADVLARIDSIVARHPGTTYEIVNESAPNWCDPDHPMVDILRRNGHRPGGEAPAPVIGLGATDMRLWRGLGIPAFVYGPSPETMGSPDERIEIEEFIHVVKTHVLSAYDYLTGG